MLDQFTIDSYGDMSDDELRDEIAYYTEEARNASNATKRAMAQDDANLYTEILEARS